MVIQRMKAQIDILEQALKGAQVEDIATAAASVEGGAATAAGGEAATPGQAIAASLSAAAIRWPEDAEIFGTLLPEEALADDILDTNTHYDGQGYATFAVENPDVDKIIENMRYIASEEASSSADPAWACPDMLPDCPCHLLPYGRFHRQCSLG